VSDEDAADRGVADHGVAKGGMAEREIRPGTALDLEIMAELHEASFPEDPWHTQVLARLLAMPGSLALLSEDRGRPAGFILMSRTLETCEILTLAVAPAARRQGRGTGLLGSALRLCAAAGAERCLLEVAVDNPTALRLYAAAGFTEAGRRTSYYQRNGKYWIDALVLARNLIAD